MRDVLSEYRMLAATGPVGRAVVTRVRGSAPRPEGATLIATADGRMAGSVTGGCVEAAVVLEIQEAIRTGRSKLVTYTVSDDQAWEVGLSCGGTIDVLVEPSVRPEVLAAAESRHGAMVASVLAGAALGAPAPEVAALIAKHRSEAPEMLSCRTVELPMPAGPVSVFLEAFPLPPRLVIVGAVHLAEVLVRMAAPVGYRTIVTDGRAALLTRDRFPGADELILGWPQETLPQLGLDAGTAVCVLTHDPKFDEPALRLALRSEAGYVGAIGSRKTQAARRTRLREEGFSEQDIARLHGPIGLDLGGRAPAEVALAILAEVTAIRHGRGGRVVPQS